jgi:aldehyde:ferredoxin oxidoreductase
MAGGYTGKILRVNLTTKSISRIDTAKYEEFGGGHGIGSAVFFDLVGEQLPFEAFDPRNLIVMMTRQEQIGVQDVSLNMLIGRMDT